ncbi:hypothetical protein DdX_14526 [Ditylenchus destructor]|uniref:Uncharacterized protein n=1 Tax=Ditylenchus destructor TaxID=166010 RepID=A0AAD4MS03_9BILA|nr:hypothetical protein DdX_14526 [Ditylenchus destructor]
MLNSKNAELQKCRKELAKRKVDEKLVLELRNENKKLICESETLKRTSEAQSQTLKTELENAKTMNERLSGMNMELQKEAERLWKKVYKSPNSGQGSSKVKKEDDNSGPTSPKKKKTKDLQ